MDKHGAPATPVASRAEEILAGERRWLWPAMMHYYDEPLVLEEGSGCWVRDADGREYLDAFGGIMTTSLGHCHPRVIEAVREQAGRLGHTSTLYVTEPQVEAARRLAAIAPGKLDRTFFTNSGSEAVETISQIDGITFPHNHKHGKWQVPPAQIQPHLLKKRHG